jgi:hypothetical protein
MTRRISALLPALLLAGAAGCVSLDFEGRRDGVPRVFNEVHHLEPGASTLADTLRRLGPPDLMLRVGPIDRLYYTSWDGFHFKVAVSAPVPLPARSVSTDAFILGLGSEDLRLARLEFDRRGILRLVQTGTFSNSTDGEYIALDNRVVENFLEDRSRALTLVDKDDDDDDDPARPPPK